MLRRGDAHRRLHPGTAGDRAHRLRCVDRFWDEDAEMERTQTWWDNRLGVAGRDADSLEPGRPQEKVVVSPISLACARAAPRPTLKIAMTQAIKKCIPKAPSETGDTRNLDRRTNKYGQDSPRRRGGHRRWFSMESFDHSLHSLWTGVLKGRTVSRAPRSVDGPPIRI